MSEAILVVHDDPLQLQWIEAVMRGAGYTVRTAADGFEALLLLKTYRADLVLADDEMPRVDGFELTRRVRSHPDSSSIVVLLVTAGSPEERRAHAFNAGCDEVIGLPIDPAALVQRVSERLKR